MGYDMYHYSRQFVSVTVRNDDWVAFCGEEEHTRGQSILEKSEVETLKPRSLLEASSVGWASYVAQSSAHVQIWKGSMARAPAGQVRSGEGLAETYYVERPCGKRAVLPTAGPVTQAVMFFWRN